MGIFRSLNRRFEAELVTDIWSDLMTKIPMPSTTLQIQCHAGRGGAHTAMEVRYNEYFASFIHYCGGKGFMSMSIDGPWHEAPWMMARKDEAVRRLAECLYEFVPIAEAAKQAKLLEASYLTEAPFIKSEVTPSVASLRTLLDALDNHNFEKFNPCIMTDLDESLPHEVIAFQMLGPDPSFLVIAKKDTSIHLSGTWQTWWVSPVDDGEIEIEEIGWEPVIADEFEDLQKVNLLVDLLGTFIAECNGIAASEILSFANANLNDDNSDFPKIFREIAAELENSAFSGENLKVVSKLDGVHEGPTITFQILLGLPRLVAIYKENALKWSAVEIIRTVDSGEAMMRQVDWSMSHGKNAQLMAAQISELTSRLTWGD